MIFVLNRNEKVVGVLRNSGHKNTAFFDDLLVEDLQTGAETFNATIIPKGDVATHLVIGNYLAFMKDGAYKLFQIMETDESHSDTMYIDVYSECAGLELINDVNRGFIHPSATLKRFATSLLENTSWKVGNIPIEINTTLDVDIKENSVYNILQEYASKYGYEVDFRVEINSGRVSSKYVDFFSHRGKVTGKRFTYNRDIDGINRKTSGENLYTALIGRGNNGLTFRDTLVHGIEKPVGQDFIGDQEAFNRYNNNGRHIMGIFNFPTDSPEELLHQTYKHLQKVKEPRVDYDVSVLLLGQLLGETWNGVKLGDTITIFDSEFIPTIQLAARVSKLETSMTNPSINKCTLSNFIEIQSNISNDMRKIAEDLENFVNSKFPIGTSDIKDDAITMDKISNTYTQTITTDILKASEVQTEKFLADFATIQEAEIKKLIADQAQINEATINKLFADQAVIINADIESLKAKDAEIEKAQIDYAKITNAEIEDLKVDNAAIHKLVADKVSTKELDAIIADIETANINIANINTLLAGQVVAGTGQYIHLTSANVVIDDAIIGSAAIKDLDASKINAGIINTNKVKIESEDGGIEIVGSTQQFKDKNGNIRMQMGQNAKGDFDIIIRAEDGKTALFTPDGITQDAIADDLIKNNMLASNSVGKKQIDYNSFTEGFNEDTNTHTLKSSKIAMDGTNQTLDVAFKQLDTTVTEVEQEIKGEPKFESTEKFPLALKDSADGMLKLHNIQGKTYQNLLTNVRNDILVQYGAVANWTGFKTNTVYTIRVFNRTSEVKQFYINEYCFTAPSEFTVQPNKTTIIKATTLATFPGVGSTIEVLLKNKVTHTQNHNMDITVMEGDWTSKEMPLYFEGIRSVNEVKENLFNKWLRGRIDSTTGAITYADMKTMNVVTDYIYVTSLTKYTLQLNKDVYSFVAFYDKDKKYISRTPANPVSSLNFETPANCIYMVLTQYNYAVEFSYSTLTSLDPKIYLVYNWDSGLEMVSYGKNLIDINKFSHNIHWYVDGVPMVKNTYLEAKVNAKSGQTIRLKFDGKISWWSFVYMNGNAFVGNRFEYTGVKELSITIPNGVSDVYFQIYHIDGIEIKDITYLQIENGTVSTDYEPYKEDRQLIPLTEPLRGFTYGTSDIINFKDCKVVRNVGKAIYNSSDSEVWNQGGGLTNTVRFYVAIPNAKSDYMLISNFPAMWTTTYNTDYDNMQVSDGYLYVRISKSKLTSYGFVDSNTATYVSSFRAYLKENPLTVYYQLATSIETSIAVSQHMKSFKDGYLSIGGTLINPKAVVEYTTGMKDTLTMVTDATKANSTLINVQQGKIDTLITETTMVKENGEVVSLKDEYSMTKQTVGEISTTVGSIQKDTSDLGERVKTTESSIKQLDESIKSKVSQTEVDKTVNAVKIGTRNIVLGSNYNITNNTYVTKVMDLSVPLVKGNKYTMVLKGKIAKGQRFGIWANSGNGHLLWFPVSTDENDNTVKYAQFTMLVDPIAGWDKKLTIYNFPNTGSANGCTVEWVAIYEDHIKPPLDWIPAPEDINQVYDYVNENTQTITKNYESAIEQTSKNINLKVSETYSTKKETSDLNESLTSMINQTTKDITFSFQGANKYTAEVDGKFTEFLKEFETYIQFDAEGITLGKLNSPFIAKLGNQELAFMQDGVKVAYISNNKLYVTDADIRNKLTIGNDTNGYFDFIPRQNGNLSLKWRVK